MADIKFPLDTRKLGPQMQNDEQLQADVCEAIIKRLSDGKVASLRAQRSPEPLTYFLLQLLGWFQQRGISRDTFDAYVFKVPGPATRCGLHAASIKIGDHEKFLPLMMERVNRG